MTTRQDPLPSPGASATLVAGVAVSNARILTPDRRAPGGDVSRGPSPEPDGAFRPPRPVRCPPGCGGSSPPRSQGSQRSRSRRRPPAACANDLARSIAARQRASTPCAAPHGSSGRPLPTEPRRARAGLRRCAGTPASTAPPSATRATWSAGATSRTPRSAGGRLRSGRVRPATCRAAGAGRWARTSPGAPAGARPPRPPCAAGCAARPPPQLLTGRFRDVGIAVVRGAPVPIPARARAGVVRATIVAEFGARQPGRCRRWTSAAQAEGDRDPAGVAAGVLERDARGDRDAGLGERLLGDRRPLDEGDPLGAEVVGQQRRVLVVEAAEAVEVEVRDRRRDPRSGGRS